MESRIPRLFLCQETKINKHDNTQNNTINAKDLKVMLPDISQQHANRKDGNDEGYQRTNPQQ